MTITNTSAALVTVALATSDSLAPTFASSVNQTTLSLPARGSATAQLTISTTAKGDTDLIDATMILATVNGVERARSNITTRLMRVAFSRALTGVGVADHSVSPSTQVDVQVSFTAKAALTSAVLTDLIPRAWSVVDAGGGTLGVVNADTQKIDWSLGDLPAGAVITKTYALNSPARLTPAPQYQFYSAVTASNNRLQSDPWQVLLEHPLTVAHFRVGRDTPLSQMIYIAATDQTAGGIGQLESFRVRFLVSNGQTSPVRWMPRLEWSTRADSGFQLVPPGAKKAGQPFFIRPLVGIQNRQTIPTTFFGLGPASRTAQNGLVITNENPAPLSSLNAQSSTEIEFSLHSTVDAAYSATYYFRLSDDDRQMSGKVAQVAMSAPVPLQLTQPQYAGIYPNAASARAPVASTSPHGTFSNLADQCASCHRLHTGLNRNLLAYVPSQSNMCFACHNGTGANTNISSQYADPSVPANDPTTSTFYSHPATAITSHTNATNDEFKGVLNRHSECGDCHNPHSGDASLTASTATGYTVSGALKNITGVDINNTWKTASTYEYELCFKCHSNYTVLLSYTKPSYMMLNQAAEFNPANASFHPIESAGKNNTTAMANSLTGTSPYKLWNFTVGSLIRCENCHGDYRLANPASPPAANARLSPHTSKYPNLLMNNYRDRVLKSAGESYSAVDFALCYECHAESPFAPNGGGSTATNFSYHSKHMTDIGGQSSSTDIDTPGAGPGRAICAECHYRVHGQGPNATGNPSGSRLVNFAPDVTASSSGQLKWDPTTRTCYMRCHGEDHNPERY